MRGALPKPTLLELDEFDITQRIIEALTTTCSHAILFSIVGKEKDAIQIAGQLQISLSSVYKTLVNLEKLSLIEIQRFHINSDNKKIKMYRSKISKADIFIDEGKSEVRLHPNKYQNQCNSISDKENQQHASYHE